MNIEEKDVLRTLGSLFMLITAKDWIGITPKNTDLLEINERSKSGIATYTGIFSLSSYECCLTPQGKKLGIWPTCK